MGTQESVPTEYAPDGAVPAGSPPPPLAKRFAWILLGTALGRFLALAVGRFMTRKLERTRRAPTLQSRNAVARLWRVEQFEDVSSLPPHPYAPNALLSPQPHTPLP